MNRSSKRLPLALLFLLAAPTGARAQGSGIDRALFRRPIRLRAAEEVIDVTNGHAAPTYVDIDGDGLRDLLVGEFGNRPFPGMKVDAQGIQPLAGRVRVYRNIGSAERARFGKFVYLTAGERQAAIPSECCIGFTPRLADLQRDGIPDLLTGSDVGAVFLFRGLGRGQFAPAVRLVSESGRPFVKDLSVSVDTGDLDGDGDLDLVLATSESAIYVVENVGNAVEAKFADKRWRLVTTENRSLWGSDARVTDWDMDGRADLVVGTDLGGVAWYRNVSEDPHTRYGRREWILSEPEEDAPQAEGSVPRRPGERTKIDVADYDSDGVTDLFVGDFATQIRTDTQLSPTQVSEYRAKRHDLQRATSDYSALLTQWRKNPPPLPVPPPAPLPPVPKEQNPAFRPWPYLPEPLPPPPKRPVPAKPPGLRPGAESMGKLTAEVDEARREVERLSHEIRTMLPTEPVVHGWVWVYRRRP